jgi:hypothetical protein
VEKMARVKQQAVTDAQIEAARARGKAEIASGASAVRYDRRHDAIILTMRSGAIATIPRILVPVVADAEPGAAIDVELSPMGTSLRFPQIDADFAVQGLIRRAFDVNQANRTAGATKSLACAAASAVKRNDFTIEAYGGNSKRRITVSGVPVQAGATGDISRRRFQR